jgi:hypothetical protein
MHAMVDLDPFAVCVGGCTSSLRSNLVMLQSSEHLPITFTGCTHALYFFTSAVDQSDAFLLGRLISPPNWP